MAEIRERLLKIDKLQQQKQQERQLEKSSEEDEEEHKKLDKLRPKTYLEDDEIEKADDENVKI